MMSTPSSISPARGGERRRDAPDRAALGPAADVHAEAELHAPHGRPVAELVVRHAALAVLHQLDAEQHALAADVADRLVALHQLLEPGTQIGAGLAAPARAGPRSRSTSITASPTAAGSGSETCEV